MLFPFYHTEIKGTAFNLEIFVFVTIAGKHGFFMKLDQPDDFNDDLGVPLLNVEVPVDGIEPKDDKDAPLVANAQRSGDNDQQSEILQPSVSDVSDVRNQFDDGEY